jgi:4-amino-4-deoxy-L-arabinose transferase-like glycosyltransferase
MDEHGNPWPIHFQSFNDYKPGLYVYLILPFIYFFGLNEWAVRIPGAFFGVLTIVSVYFLVREMFSKRKAKDTGNIDLFSSLLLAISPWHIHFSRGGWEVNVASFFIVTGLLFFYKGLKKSSYFVVSIIFFVLSLYTYHAARILVPTLGVLLLMLYWSDIWKNKIHVLGGSIIGFLLVIPLILELFGPAGISRAAGVGLLADPGPLNRINELRGQHTDFQNESATLFHNKGVNYGLAFLENWAKHFEGEFLFLSGDIIQRNRVPETGQTHMLFIFLFAAGIYKIARYVSWKEVFHIKVPHPESETKALTFLLLWLIVSPLAASLTFQSPHALRAQNMVIPLEIINALGLSVLISWAHTSLKSKYLLSLFYIVIILITTLGLGIALI